MDKDVKESLPFTIKLFKTFNISCFKDNTFQFIGEVVIVLQNTKRESNTGVCAQEI